MTTDERIDAIAKTLEPLTGVTASLAGTVASHDRQIGVLITEIAELKSTAADLVRQWQAYLIRIPSQ